MHIILQSDVFGYVLNTDDFEPPLTNSGVLANLRKQESGTPFADTREAGPVK